MPAALYVIVLPEEKNPDVQSGGGFDRKSYLLMRTVSPCGSIDLTRKEIGSFLVQVLLRGDTRIGTPGAVFTTSDTEQPNEPLWPVSEVKVHEVPPTGQVPVKPPGLEPGKPPAEPAAPQFPKSWVSLELHVIVPKLPPGQGFGEIEQLPVRPDAAQVIVSGVPESGGLEPDGILIAKAVIVRGVPVFKELGVGQEKR